MGVSFIEHSFLDASHAAIVGVSFIESIHSLMPPMQPSCLPCSLRGCFIQREHSFLDASHAAFVGVSFIESIHSLMPPMQPSWSHQQCGPRAVLPVLSQSPEECQMLGDTDRVLQPHHRQARAEKEGACVGVAVNVEEPNHL